MTKGRILCTEDDPDSREMLSMFLTTCGYEVVCPFDSADALTLSGGKVLTSSSSTTGCQD